MTRLIDADELLKYKTDHEMISTHLIYNAPTVDAEPVRHGQWLSREEGVVYPFWERYTCSACGKHADNTEYCPHCGARMVKDD